MPYLKKSRFKPLFKKFIKLRENVQDRQKLLKFKKKKWETFLAFYKKKLKNYKKFKPLDQLRYFNTKYGTRGTGYKKRYRDTLHASKRFRLLYGNILKRYLKNKIKFLIKKPTSNFKILLLELFENRLDNILYKSKFSTTIKEAQQLILHGKIYINNKQVKSKAYLVKSGDLIRFNPKSLKLYEKNLLKSNKWPIPPKHLLINYRTMEILILNNITYNTLPTAFTFNLRLQKIIVNFPKI